MPKGYAVEGFPLMIIDFKVHQKSAMFIESAKVTRFQGL